MILNMVIIFDRFSSSIFVHFISSMCVICECPTDKMIRLDVQEEFLDISIISFSFIRAHMLFISQHTLDMTIWKKRDMPEWPAFHCLSWSFINISKKKRVYEKFQRFIFGSHIADNSSIHISWNWKQIFNKNFIFRDDHFSLLCYEEIFLKEKFFLCWKHHASKN